MTNQEIFDTAVKGLESQGYKRSINSNGSCLYNGPDNTHCAVGWLIKDEDLDPDAATYGVASLLFMYPSLFKSLGTYEEVYEKLPFLEDLQTAHDGAESPEMMCGNLKYIADKYGLECSLTGPNNLGPNGVGTTEYSIELIAAMDKAIEEAHANV